MSSLAAPSPGPPSIVGVVGVGSRGGSRASAVRVFTIRGWTLALPQQLTRRIHAQIRQEEALERRQSKGAIVDPPSVHTAHHEQCALADSHTPTTSLAVRLNLRLEMDSHQATIDTTSHSSPTTPSENSSLRSDKITPPHSHANEHIGTGASPAAVSLPPPPPAAGLLSLPEVHSSVSFLLSHFPFVSLANALDGVATFLLLWGRLGAGGGGARAADDRGGDDTTSQPSLPFPAPSIARVRIEGEIFSPSSPSLVLQTYTTDRRAEQERLLGRDVNQWGDVDIVLQVEPPTAAAAATITSTTPNDNVSLAKVASACSHCSAPSAGLYCLNILPFHRIPLHVHNILDESELIFSHGILVQDAPSPAEFGTVHSWERLPHVYENPTRWVQRILCIDVPMFIPSDEVVVQQTGALVKPKNSGVRWSEFLSAKEGTPTPNGTKQSEQPQSTWTFPGGLPSQTVTLSTDVASFKAPHAVLLFAYNHPTSTSSAAASGDSSTALCSLSTLPHLLFVHHRTRGWELPGGKVEPHETPLEAVRREAREEAGIQYDDATTNEADAADEWRPIAQYTIVEPGQEEHVKTVFVGRVKQQQLETSAVLTHETKEARFLSPPVWQELVESAQESPKHPTTASGAMRFSSILHDNVYPLCLQLSLASLGPKVSLS